SGGVRADPAERAAIAQGSVESKTGPRGPVQIDSAQLRLLDLRFLELDVLARDRVVLFLDQLVGHGARILLGDVIEAGVRRRNELDLDGDRFGHVQNLYVGYLRISGAGQIGPHLPRNLASIRPKSRFWRQKLA